MDHDNDIIIHQLHLATIILFCPTFYLSFFRGRIRIKYYAKTSNELKFHWSNLMFKLKKKHWNKCLSTEFEFQNIYFIYVIFKHVSRQFTKIEKKGYEEKILYQTFLLSYKHHKYVHFLPQCHNSSK